MLLRSKSKNIFLKMKLEKDLCYPKAKHSKPRESEMWYFKEIRNKNSSFAYPDSRACLDLKELGMLLVAIYAIAGSSSVTKSRLCGYLNQACLIFFEALLLY